MKYDVVVIGAGASGMMAAVQAAKCGRKTALLEVLGRPGKKLLVTGNGKCNLTNYKLNEECYHTDSGNKKDIMNVIGCFDSKAVTDFFREEGMLVRDRDGYVYPYSEQASSVLDALRHCLDKYGVELVCDCEIGMVRKSADTFLISGIINEDEVQRKLSCSADKLIVATGSAAGGVCDQGSKKASKGDGNSMNSRCGLGYRIARDMGHHIVKPLPALVALNCEERFFKEISGVRAKAYIKLMIDGKYVSDDYGELQITDTGISGIPAFQVSRYAVGALDAGKKKVQAVIDFMPEYDEQELSEYISGLQKYTDTDSDGHSLALTDILTGLVNKKLMALMIKLSGGRTKELVRLLKGFTVNIVKDKGIAAAQVCRGGVRLDEVDAGTLESKLCKGLYFCGEILDVDGCCGGYNLQWAWSSGYIAGKACGK